MKPDVIYTDYNGQSYESKDDMLKVYGLKSDTFDNRIKSGWSLERALTTPVKERRKPVDHTGRHFTNTQEMCDFWGVNISTYSDRRRHGHTIEESLTGTNLRKGGSRAIVCTDHTGQNFPSIKDMCNHWHVSVNYYKKKIAEGFSIKDALTTSSQRYQIHDHLGNAYSCIDDMCDAYHITKSVYYNRNRAKWSLEKILTTPLRHTKTVKHETKAERTDHLGTVYPDIQSMCDAYSIEVLTYQRRLERGWDKKTALTEPIDTTKHGMQVTDPYGNQFPMLKDMLAHYQIKTSAWFERKRKDYTDAEALGIIPLIGPQIKNQKVNDNLYIFKAILDEETDVLYFHCFSDNKETLYCRNDLLELYKTTLSLVTL